MSDDDADAAFDALWREVVAEASAEWGDRPGREAQRAAAYYLLTGRREEG